MSYIPGTVILRSDFEGISGMGFLRTVYKDASGIKLSKVREITGVDGMNLQNWVKRGWVMNPVNKTYDIDQLARIIIINMMRDTVQLSKISFLLEYINGDVSTPDDDIIQESVLYGYVCSIIDILNSNSVADLSSTVKEVISDYTERFDGARHRLESALEIIVMAYEATLIKRYTDSMIDKIIQ